MAPPVVAGIGLALRPRLPPAGLALATVALRTAVSPPLLPTGTLLPLVAPPVVAEIGLAPAAVTLPHNTRMI